MAIKMEIVHEELKNWGELIVVTDGGKTFEIHLGDTTFDYDNRLIRLKTPQAEHVLPGDSIDNITKHYGHQVE